MSDQTESVLDLIDTLCNKLSENLISSEISQLSKIRQNFVKDSKVCIWTSLLNPYQENIQTSKP